MLDSKVMIGLPLTVFAAVAVTSVGSDDPLLTLALGLGGAFVVGALWPAGASPVVALPIITQFSQIATTQIYANLLGVPVNDVSLQIGDVTSATWFALAGLTSLVVGLQISQRGVQTSIALLHREARNLSLRATFAFCCCTIGAAAVLELLAGINDSLGQALLAAAGIQWIGLFMLTCVCFSQGRGKFSYLLPVLAVEILKGFTGFFGDFRLPFFVVLIGIASATPKLRVSTIFAGVIGGLALIVMSTWWSSIKSEYRDYVSGGSREQVIVVPLEERMLYLADKLYGATLDSMSDGLDKLARRLGYVDFLAATMRNVPSRMPHENGAQVGGALLHILQPRFLFPDKPPLPSDTELTERVTGIFFSATSGGVSVSLGYLAELYIDFGQLGAIAMMFLIGMGVGYGFRFVMTLRSVPTIVAYGCAVMVALTITEFGEALVKMVGGFVTSLVVSVVLARFVLPPLVRAFALIPSSRIELQPSH